MAFTHHTIELNGQRYAYLDEGEGPLLVFGLPGDMEQPRQHLGHDAVARRHRVVMDGLGPGDDVFGVVGAEEISLGRVVPVVRVGGPDPALRAGQVFILSGDTQQDQRRPGHGGVIVNGRRMAQAAGAPGML